MFEDSLVESTGRIRMHSRRYVVGSFAMQSALALVLVLIPYLYPATLPQEALSTLLVAPPPPSEPAQLPHAPASHAASPVQLAALTAPSVIPRRVIPANDSSSTPPGMDDGMRNIGLGNIPGAIAQLGSAPPLLVVARAKPSGPVRVSAGVAAGRLLTPIQPVYPAIAMAARIQGTIVVEAIISAQGFVEQARAVSGPPMLAQAALTAVNRARYDPYKLNGEPVEVETTISIIFTLEN